MENHVITTALIKPQAKKNIGIMISPTIVDFLGQSFDIKRSMGINLLNSYYNKEPDLDFYLKELKNNFISYDSLLIDTYLTNELNVILDYIFSLDFIKEKKKTVYRCDCLTVDTLNIDSYNNKLYYKNNNKFYCTKCHKEVIEYSDYVLVMKFCKEDFKDIDITPSFLKKEILTFSNKLNNYDMLISKKRNTKFQTKFNGSVYNIDVDFVCMNFIQLFKEKNISLVLSNHQVFYIFLLNFIAQKIGNKNLKTIATPYLISSINDIKNDYAFKSNEYFKKLFILFQLSFKTKDNKVCEGLIKYLQNCNDNVLKDLYYISKEEARSGIEQLNFQKVLQIYKSGGNNEYFDK